MNRSLGVKIFDCTDERRSTIMSQEGMKTLQPVSVVNQAWRVLGAVLQPIMRVGNTACEFGGWQAEAQPCIMPEEIAFVSPTPKNELEEVLQRLASKKEEWVAVSTEERAEILAECRKKFFVQNSIECSKTATRAHGANISGIGEELASWLPIGVGLLEYETAMRANGEPPLAALYQRANGQYVAETYPQGLLSLSFGSMRGEVWIQKGKRPTQGALYKKKKQPNGWSKGEVALVLGAGNQINVVFLDIVHKLFAEDQVVVVKMNPLNSFLGQYIKRLLAPLVERGFVEIVFGDVEEAAFLCKHKLVDCVHLTGSAATYNAIVWGGNPKGKTEKINEKPVHGELGCVTPCIIVPGFYTQEEMKYQAKSIATGLLQNSGHNCSALELIVTAKNWSQREQFIKELQNVLNDSYMQCAWYKNSAQKFAAFEKKFAKHGVQKLGKRPENDEEKVTSPWMFVTGLSPEEADTQTENWCGVLQEVCLPDYGDEDVGGFLEAAVKFANEKCWGSLSCCLFVKPDVQEKNRAAFEKALEDLKYGSIVVNGPTHIAFAVTSGVWGAFPGNSPEDIGSGNCFVHNTLLLDHPEKAVVYCPWNLSPKPIWFHTLSNKEVVLRGFMEFLANPHLWNLIKAIPPMLYSEW